MKKGIKRQLFFSTLRLSACTFGGGFVIVALMRRRFVDELSWIDEKEMLDMTAIAQSSPGAVAVNAAILLGYHMAGLPGAAAALGGAVLPPLVIISVISMFYQAFRQNVLVSMAMKGMLAGVAAVIADVVITMAAPMLQTRGMLVKLALAFILVQGFSLPIPAALLLFGMIGAVHGERR